MKWSAQKEKLDSGAEFFNSFISFRHSEGCFFSDPVTDL